MEKQRKSVVVFTVLYGVMFVMGGNRVIGSLFSLTSEQRIFFQFVLYILLCWLGIVAYREELRQKWQWIRTHKTKSLGILVLGFIVTSLADTLFSLLVVTLTSVFNLELISTNPNTVAFVFNHFSPIISILILGVAGPLVEEFFFRQFLVGRLSEKCSKTVAIVVSAVLFVLNHAQRLQTSELLTVLLHLPAGIIWGILFLRTNKNIYFSSCLHIFNNVTAFLL
ncbi:hypothetical protein BU202_07425 [Streptococcus cuniculi]|uniref:CAAX prenyl protease 2/Lysostaphin resistance protein A-like domain-containing protein n=1 Tax=Streptococcus cuniculi TaxID=1432788 RepID=A0A1Q8E6Q2_9STRE|nr:type II CAAX endopeptidase family protein [Streptococcus cuniculi]OLF47482.1 hypothetical protein BU202_07425 [Streptococcus cuniculi]